MGSISYDGYERKKVSVRLDKNGYNSGVMPEV
jgi:hypothetical protein